MESELQDFYIVRKINGISAIKQGHHLHLKCDQILSVSAQA